MACCKNVKSGCFDERFANYPRAEVMDRHSGCITRLRQKKVLKTVKVSKQKSPSLKFLEIKDLEIKGRLISQPRRCKEVNDVAYVVLTGLKHCWCKAAGTCMHCASPRQQAEYSPVRAPPESTAWGSVVGVQQAWMCSVLAAVVNERGCAVAKRLFSFLYLMSFY